MEETIDYIFENQQSIINTIEIVKSSNPENQKFSINIGNIKKKFNSNIKKREINQYKKKLNNYKEVYKLSKSIIKENKEMSIFYNEMKSSIKEIKIEDDFILEIKEILKNLKEISLRKNTLKKFCDDFKISDKDLNYLVFENYPIDDIFFDLYKKLNSNIDLRNTLIKKEILDNKLLENRSIADYNNSYILAKKLALRKFTQFFVKNFENFKYDFKKNKKYLFLINENREEEINKLNTLILKITNQDFKKNLNQFKLNNKNPKPKNIKEIIYILCYFINYYFFYISILTRKLPNKEFYYQNNLNSLFENIYSIFEEFKNLYKNQKNFEIEDLYLIDSFLYLQILIKSKTDKKYKLIINRFLIFLINELKVSLKKKLDFFFKNILSFKESSNYNFILDDHLQYFELFLRFSNILENKEFLKLFVESFLDFANRHKERKLLLGFLEFDIYHDDLKEKIELFKNNTT